MPTRDTKIKGMHTKENLFSPLLKSFILKEPGIMGC